MSKLTCRSISDLGPGESFQRHWLDVYVAGHCPGCDQTREICAMVEARFPDVRVRLTDLDDEPQKKPPVVVAVPAFVLDGAVIFFGNPHADKLLARLESALGDGPRNHHHG